MMLRVGAEDGLVGVEDGRAGEGCGDRLGLGLGSESGSESEFSGSSSGRCL